VGPSFCVVNRAERDSLPIGSPKGGRGGARQPVPAPLVFEFVVDVLRVGPLAVEPGEGFGGVGARVERGDEHGDFPGPRRGTAGPAARLGQHRLAVVAPPPRVLADGRDGGAFAHEDHAPLPAPAAQPQAAFEDFPPVARRLPTRPGARHLRDEHFDFWGVLQLEKAGHCARLGLHEELFISIRAVPADERGPVRARQRVEQRPQAGQPVPRGVFFSSAHLDAQAQPHAGHEVAVVAMAGAPGLVRVVADLRALLVAVERLDRAINVEHPRHAQHRLDARAQFAREPRETGAFVHALHRPPHHIFADGAAHAQQRRVERVAAHRVDVRRGEAPGAGQCPQSTESAAVPMTLTTSLPRLPW